MISMTRFVSVLCLAGLMAGMAVAQSPCASSGANPARADWFCDPAATNPAALGTKDDPFSTLGAALAVADDNDRIFLGPGTYGAMTEAYPYSVGIGSVFSALNLEIIGYAGAASTILDGMGMVTSGSGLLRFRLGAAGAKLSGVTITGYAGGLGAIRLGSTSANFEAFDVEITQCIIENSSAWGIATFGASAELKIHNNLFRNCLADALWLSDVSGATNPCGTTGGGGDIYNNTIDGCDNGIRLQGGTWNVFNNIMVNNTSAGIYDFGGAPTFSYTVDNNCYFGNGTDYGAGITPGANDVLADPLFLNPLAGDYTIVVGSPCQDAGTASVPAFVAADLDGNPRFVTGPGGMLLPDMGCLEATDVLHLVGPVSIAAGAVSLDVVGPAGDLVIRALSADTANNLLAPGNLLLGLPSLFILDISLATIPANGLLSLPILTAGIAPSAIGAVVYTQAGVAGPSGSRFTNMVTSIICP